MSKIFKYKIDPGHNLVLMPSSSTVISAAEQMGFMVIWAIVDPQCKPVEREIYAAGTGHDFHQRGMKFINTVQMPSGLVWHVFSDEK